MTPDTFPDIHLAGELRPSQRKAVDVARRELDAGGRRLHIVAPPGAGKTVLGLYLWAECIRVPALVLSPNSAIQAQWAARLDLFRSKDAVVGELASTDPRNPALFTSLTYQSVTMPGRGDEESDAGAIALWRANLIEKGQVHSPEEAGLWIDDLKNHNRSYYNDRLGHYRRQLREMISLGGEALSTVHASVQATLQRLKDRSVGLIIFDECHHLLGHWGRVLEDVRDLLDTPVVIGLTATPPALQGRKPADIARYEKFFGPVDFEVPIPALVKEGNLAPYQDLAYFVRPTDREVRYVAETDREFHEIVEEFCKPATGEGEKNNGVEPLPDWLKRVVAGRELPTGPVRDWAAFERRDKAFADAARLFLAGRGERLPDGVPPPPPDVVQLERSELDVLVPVLDRYIRHGLRRSPNPGDHERAERAISRLRMVGMQVTETGTQPCASPVGRVMAYSSRKVTGLVDILKKENRVLGDRLRAVVVTDFTRSSAMKAEVTDLMDDEAGGAVAAFRALLTDEETDALDPILVTASTVLVDDDLLERFHSEARAWLSDHGFDIELRNEPHEGYYRIHGQGGDWSPRLYVQMITELFQKGVTRCLVGTRGLLGEGWDANKVNVLIDLTTVTTSMSVNQLRGRSLRLDPEDGEKLSNNWDVVCVAGEFTKGLDDYQRFMAKHRTLFGVSDDGAVEKGVGHVHAAFTEMKPEGVEGALNLLNDEMLQRAEARDRSRELWRVGEPFDAEPVSALEFKNNGIAGGFKPFRGAREKWTDDSLTQAVARAVWFGLQDAGLIRLGGTIYHAKRAGGYARMYLKGAAGEESGLFTRSLREALGPLDRPRYVIPRYVDEFKNTWISWLFPSVLARYLRKRVQRIEMLHAVPAALARNKESVGHYQLRWNEYVSPGEAIYAHHGEGENLVADARNFGQVPAGAGMSVRMNEKEVFV
jgi:superfamily II DNA or RNA helicase